MNEGKKKAGTPFLGGGMRWRARPRDGIVILGATPVYTAKA
jgi:hypothetical protein